MARRRAKRSRVPAGPVAWRSRALAAILLAALIGAVCAWWFGGAWTPSRDSFPVQGVLIKQGESEPSWPTLKAIGADFAYLAASDGARGHNRRFPAALAGAREAGLQVGAVHRFDPCHSATRQAQNFVVIVPRDPSLLPPAIELEIDAAGCPDPPSEGGVQSELTTFLNQIETHTGKRAILILSRGFEKRYGLARVIERNLWVSGDYLAPGYPGRPWVLWTANSRLRNPAGSEDLRWVVVQP